MSSPSSHATWLPWAKRLLWVGVAGAVVFIALTLVLSRYLDPEALATRVEPRLEAALSRDVEVGRVEVGLFPLGIRLADVSVSDPTGLAPNLATVEAIEFRVALLPLLKKEVRVSRLVLEKPIADLRVGPDGGSNFGDLSPQEAPEDPAGTEDPETQGFALALKGIRVSEGTFRYENPNDSTTISVTGLSAKASVHHDPVGPWLFEGDADGSVALTDTEEQEDPGGTLPLSLDFDLAANSDFQSLEIRSGSIGLDPLFLDISGRVDGFKDPVREVDLDLVGEGVPLSEVVEAAARQVDLHLPGELQGFVDAALHLEGELGPGRTPDVYGTVALTQGGLEARDGVLIAQDISAHFGFETLDRIQIEIAGEVLDGPFSADGSAALGGSGSLNVQVTGNPDLSLLHSGVELPEGVTAEGRLDTRVRVTGSYDNLRSFRFRGSASPSAVELTHPALAEPLILSRGRISLVGNGAQFSELPISIGTDRVVVSGEIQNISSYGIPGRTVGIRGTVRGPRLDLTKISPNTPPDPSLTYGRIAFAHLGDRRLGALAPEDAARELRLSRPDSLLFSGSLQFAIDTIIYARGKLNEVRARAEFGRSLLRVTEASFKRFGGDLWVSTNLSLGRGVHQPFNLVVRARDLDAQAFLRETTPAGEVVRGRLSLDLDLVGSLDGLLLPNKPSLTGSGNFALTDGGLSSMPLTQALSAFMGGASVREPSIDDWATSFIMEDGLIRLADARLAGTPGDPVLGGSIGFDGALDMLSSFEIDADNLGSYALENLGIEDALAGRMAGRPGIVQAFVRIGGNVLAPEFQGGPEQTAGALSQEVSAEVQAEAQRRIQEQRTQLQSRATGFLRGLLQGPDTTQVTPGDSAAVSEVPADSIPPDTLGAEGAVGDTLPPDTTGGGMVLPVNPADSIRPDSIPPDTSGVVGVEPDTIVGDTVVPDSVPPDTMNVRVIRRGFGR